MPPGCPAASLAAMGRTHARTPGTHHALLLPPPSPPPPYAPPRATHTHLFHAWRPQEKRAADDAILGLQTELARLLEANSRLQAKLEGCEHNTEETRDAIEDMELQIIQAKTQKENQLAVLSGE
eukprot:7390836-Prymnesium_polylepis.1